MSKHYIGLDLGSKTLGIAISYSGMIAQSYETFRFKENAYDEAIKYLVAFIQSNRIDCVVIGLPKHMNNDLGLRGQISVDFKTELEKHIKADIVLWDERLTTHVALKTMQGAKKTSKKNKKDEMAAQLILQNYLDYINQT